MSDIEECEEYLCDREIIAFVRSNPLLWEKRIKIDKKSRDTIDQAFSQIGSLLSKPLTGDAVSIRWKSLRDQYSREMRKVTTSQSRSGAGAEKLSYKPMWSLFTELFFLKDVIKPRNIYHCKTQSNVSRKKLKLCQDISDNPVNIVIPSINTRTPKTTEAVIWIDNQEKSQVIEENQIIEKSQVVEENLWNILVKDTTASEPEDDIASACSSSMSTSVSQLSTIPPPDNFYIKKKVAIEKVHGIIESTAEKINSVCDTTCVNLTQPEHTPSIEEDSALVLIKSFLKKVPSNMKVRCLSEIMAVLDKYTSNVPQ